VELHADHVEEMTGRGAGMGMEPEATLGGTEDTINAFNGSPEEGRVGFSIGDVKKLPKSQTLEMRQLSVSGVSRVPAQYKSVVRFATLDLSSPTSS
jgi:hypothetical protein